MNQYVTRVQSFLQDGTPDNDVLLYYNIADVMSEQGTEAFNTLADWIVICWNLRSEKVR